MISNPSKISPTGRLKNTQSVNCEITCTCFNNQIGLLVLIVAPTVCSKWDANQNHEDVSTARRLKSKFVRIFASIEFCRMLVRLKAGGKRNPTQVYAVHCHAHHRSHLSLCCKQVEQGCLTSPQPRPTPTTTTT